MGKRLFATLTAALTIAFVATGCAADGEPAASQSATVIASSPRVRSTEMPIPISLIPDAELVATPADDTATLLSFAARKSTDEFVRILEPDIVYRNGGATPSPVPIDYVSYLESLRADGVKISAPTSVTVGGIHGSEFSISSLKNIENSIGCPSTGGIADDTCWGISAGLSLRFVVLAVSGRVVLIWARTGLNQPDPKFDADFQTMLATITFP